MENSVNKNSLSEKPDFKKEPITNHDAGLNNENGELYGDLKDEKPLKDNSPPLEKDLNTKKEENCGEVDNFIDEEDIVNSEFSPTKKKQSRFF